MLLRSDAMAETPESILPISKPSSFHKKRNIHSRIHTNTGTFLLLFRRRDWFVIILPHCRRSANNKGSPWQKINTWNTACYNLPKNFNLSLSSARKHKAILKKEKSKVPINSTQFKMSLLHYTDNKQKNLSHFLWDVITAVLRNVIYLFRKWNVACS